jgi:hypothetical protein
MCPDSGLVKHPLGNYRSVGERADRRVLSLFPSLSYWVEGISVKRQSEVLRSLACVYSLGVAGSEASATVCQSRLIVASPACQEPAQLPSYL